MLLGNSCPRPEQQVVHEPMAAALRTPRSSSVACVLPQRRHEFELQLQPPLRTGRLFKDKQTAVPGPAQPHSRVKARKLRRFLAMLLAVIDPSSIMAE